MAGFWSRKAPLLAALCLWVATIGLPVPALAFTPPQPAWNQLSSPQQEALKPLAGEWDKLDNFRKKKWLGVAEKFSSMAPDAQKRLHARMGDWARMTPEQKKAEWQKYQKLPDAQKQRIAAAADATKPVKQKQERRAQTANAKTAKPAVKTAQGAPAPTVPPATAPVASTPVPPEAPAATSTASPTAPSQAPATIAAPAAVGVPPAPAAALTAPATSN